MTTQREPDTSAEGLRRLADAAFAFRIGAPSTTGLADAAEWLQALALHHVAVEAVLRALADAAGQAAPVLPPVEGLETTQVERDIFRQDAQRRDAEKIGFGSVGTYPRWALALLRDFDRLLLEHDRAEGLAKEVERLKDAAATAAKTFHDNQWQQLKEAEAKLAVYEAPIGDAEVKALITSLNRIAAGARRFAGMRASLVAEWFKSCADRFDEAITVLRRLSAAHAECKGENTKLRGALKPFASEADRYDPDDGDGEQHLWLADGVLRIKHLRAARAALAPASGEKAT